MNTRNIRLVKHSSINSLAFSNLSRHTFVTGKRINWLAKYHYDDRLSPEILTPSFIILDPNNPLDKIPQSSLSYEHFHVLYLQI